jgi:hypothetical protein
MYLQYLNVSRISVNWERENTVINLPPRDKNIGDEKLGTQIQTLPRMLQTVDTLPLPESNEQQAENSLIKY